MTTSINRRSFLQALIAIGATFALPASASDSEVDKVWQVAQENPWFFDVNDFGTITDADFCEPVCWDEVFDIATNWLRTPGAILDAVLACQPLCGHFRTLAEDELLRLEVELGALPLLDTPQRQKLVAVTKALKEDPDEGWQTWIELGDDDDIARFKKHIDDWLGEPVDMTQSEWFPMNAGNQGQSKRFFENLDYAILDALNVVIVDGDCPGSSYYAAKLRGSIQDANETAQELELPFRFKTVGAIG